jgi:chromosome segregation ATPase
LQAQIEPIQNYLDELIAIGQQLDPLDIAESEVRFIQLSQDELTTNHADLIDQLKSEASDENHINSAITELHQKLRTILAELPDLDKDGLERVRNEALPAMKKQLNDINSRNATAEQNRQLIKREWPDENTTQNTAQSLIDQIDGNNRQQYAIEEWLSHKDEMRQQMANLSVQNLETTHDDAEALLGLSDKLRQLRQFIQNSIQWLSTKQDLPDKSTTLKQLQDEVLKVENEEAKLKALLGHIPTLERLEERQNQLKSRLETLRLKADQIRDSQIQQSAVEDWLDRKQELKQQMSDIQREVSNISVEDEIEWSSEHIDTLQHLKDSINDTINWVRQNENIPYEIREQSIQQLESAKSMLENNLALLIRIRNQLSTVLNQLQDLEDRHDVLVEELERLREKDEHARQQVQSIEDDITSQHDDLFNSIHEAGLTVNDPNASIDQLQRSIEIIEKSRPKLEEIERIYNELDEDNAQTAELKRKTADKLQSLNNLFEHQQTSANNRIQMILQKYHDQLNDLIKQAEQSLVNSKTQPGEYDEISALLLSSIEEAESVGRDELNEIVKSAKDTRRQVDEKWDLWKRFKKIRNKIGDKQDALQTNIETVQNDGLRSLSEVPECVNLLEVKKCKFYIIYLIFFRLRKPK